MSWRKASRAIIAGVTLLTIGFALLAGHVSTDSRAHDSRTPTAAAVRPCVRVTSATGHHGAAIKCP